MAQLDYANQENNEDDDSPIQYQVLLFFQRRRLVVGEFCMSFYIPILNYFQQIMHYIFGELCTKNSRLCANYAIFLNKYMLIKVANLLLILFVQN